MSSPVTTNNSPNLYPLSPPLLSASPEGSLIGEQHVQDRQRHAHYHHSRHPHGRERFASFRLDGPDSGHSDTPSPKASSMEERKSVLLMEEVRFSSQGSSPSKHSSRARGPVFGTRGVAGGNTTTDGSDGRDSSGSGGGSGIVNESLAVRIDSRFRMYNVHTRDKTYRKIRVKSILKRGGLSMPCLTDRAEEFNSQRRELTDLRVR